MKERFEYWLVLAVARTLGWLPRRLARLLVRVLTWSCYLGLSRLRRVGERNLELALPELPSKARRKILRHVFRNLGWQMVEFCRLPRYSAENTRGWIRTEGLEHYLAAKAKQRGVLVLTGHLGAWELSSFYHSLMGNPMGMVIRRLDNRLLDDYVNSMRCLHGNKVLHKDDFARGLLTAMRAGETVGILMDTNMTPPQGVFVNFFGIPACTASGLARIAVRTDAAVVPTFTIWDPALRKYRLRFDPALKFVRTGNDEEDIVSNTQLFTKVIEDYVRRYPDQWLWLHRRWKTRPEGEPSLY